MAQKAFEVNFDGLVGPTHNYSGLAYGNVASIQSQGTISNPRAAALQGLEKMHHLHQMGLKQALLLPQERPHIPTLRALGFDGSDAIVLAKVQKEFPELLAECSSAACMWTANAATVSPSADTYDHRLHITPANLCSKFHRFLEPPITSKLLKKIFADPNHFVHHPPLPSHPAFADEGAANHTRLCDSYEKRGIHLFVYGRKAFKPTPLSPKIFPARQTLEASQALAKTHLLPSNSIVFAQQHPDAIDSGVFHNDVVSVGNKNLFFYHEQAFVNTKEVLEELKKKVHATCKKELILLEVQDEDISLKDAVQSYLFNSQIVTYGDGTTSLIAPIECQRMQNVHQYLEQIIASPANPISQIHYINLHESMRNGGGPACLRLRVVLTEEEIQAVHSPIFLTETLYKNLRLWIETHYRDRLSPNDLADPQLLEETRTALDQLTKLLQLGSLYDFQTVQ